MSWLKKNFKLPTYIQRMGFSEEKLAEYLIRGKMRSPQKTAMNWLKQLLFKEINEYCAACEGDRMLCVMSPKCTERILLKVRMQADATPDQLPRFCYSQSLNNLKRYLEKKTTLYQPVDVWIYAQDYIDVVFPKLKIQTFKQNLKNPKEIHNAIRKSNVPAVYFDLKNIDAQMFRRIIERDKMIKEGTFLYDLRDTFLLIWYEKQISITDFETNITVCNAAYDIIEKLTIVDMVFQIYCAEFNINHHTTYKSENEILLSMNVPFKDLKEDIEKNLAFLDEFIKFLQNYFFEIHINLDPNNNFVVSVSYQNVEKLLDRIGLIFITYDGIRQIISNFFNLTKKSTN
jgi:hypothetical protein